MAWMKYLSLLVCGAALLLLNDMEAADNKTNCGGSGNYL